MLEGAPIISTASVWLGLSLQATRSLQPKFTGSILSAPTQSVRGSMMETVAQGVNKHLHLARLHANVERHLALKLQFCNSPKRRGCSS